MPAAWLPRSLLDQVEPALRQLLVSLVELPSPQGRDAGIEKAVDSVRAANFELARHAGRDGEACVLTKDAVFEVSDLLTRARSLFSEAGLHAAALVVAAIDDRLVERIIETQPMTPA